MLPIRRRGRLGAEVIRTEAGRMSHATAITNVRIFDGQRAISATTVVIGGARIEAVGPSVPRDAVVVDGRGATLMPGLIDSHVHPTWMACTTR